MEDGFYALQVKLDTTLLPRVARMRFLEVVVALVIREFQHRRPKLTKD